jgi:hypothetical protein
MVDPTGVVANFRSRLEYFELLPLQGPTYFKGQGHDIRTRLKCYIVRYCRCRLGDDRSFYYFENFTFIIKLN